jgi:molybdopterin/thiamine biosynthesis adenylyltransferase
LFDRDSVEKSNINRLHGATLEDAKQNRKKVSVVKDSIDQVDIGTDVVTIDDWVMGAQCHDALKACDIIFGCSDDNQGRLFLNRLAYYYLTPVIDVGLAMELSDSQSMRFQALDGRVSVLLPGTTCLMCRGVIDVQRAASESLQRSNPSEFERQKEEAYVLGEGDPNPAVVTFTTEVATMAVNEMIQRLQGYRGPDGATDHRVRLFHRMHDLRPSDKPSEDCVVCGSDTVWGRGDVTPFLDIVG